METEYKTIDEKFFYELAKHMENGEELSIKQIYSLFPDVNSKTISWRLHKFVQQGKLRKIGHGQYNLYGMNEHNAAGYDYLQNKSRMVYDIIIDYGYGFYITGLDSLIGEILHIPEQYPVLLVVEEAGIKELQSVLNEKGLVVITQKDKGIVEKFIIQSKFDVIILKGKDFTLSAEHIAQKEKGFVDLYYAITRMEYGISIQELSRIYQSLQRNHSMASAKVKDAARDMGISVEINWLMEINKVSDKVIEFMSYQMKKDV